MQPRPYQLQAIHGCAFAWTNHRRVALEMATGLGKTFTAAWIIALLLRLHPGKRAMFVVDTEELADQAAAEIEKVTGLRVGIERAELRADSFTFRPPVVVGTWQTLVMSKRLKKFDPKDFIIVIPDEAHVAAAPSYITIHDYFYSGSPDCLFLYMSATLYRSDDKDIPYDVLAYSMDIKEGIRQGYLARVTQNRIIVNGLDLSGVRCGKDFNEEDLADLMGREEVLVQMASAVAARLNGRKALMFCPRGRGGGKKPIHKLQELFRAHGIDAAVVTQDTPGDERKQIVKDYHNGKIRLLLNYGVFTKGFNDPGTEVIVIARPTMSRSLYTQMVGRGTRMAEGKDSVEVMDLVGNAGKHSVCSALGLMIGKLQHPELGDVTDDVLRVAEEMAEGEADAVEIDETLNKAYEVAIERLERKDTAVREQLRASPSMTVREVNALVSDSVSRTASLDVINPDAKPSLADLALCHKLGWDTKRILTVADAQKAMAQSASWLREGKLSVKQRKTLRKWKVDLRVHAEIIDGFDARERWRTLFMRVTQVPVYNPWERKRVAVQTLREFQRKEKVA